MISMAKTVTTPERTDGDGDHYAQQGIEDEVPPYDVQVRGRLDAMACRHRRQGPAEDIQTDPNQEEDSRSHQDIVPGHPEQAAGQNVVGMRVTRFNPYEEHGAGRCNGIRDADDCLNGYVALFPADHGIESCHDQHAGQ